MLVHDPQLAEWVYGVAHGEPEPSGHFLKAFADAVLRADPQNYAYLKPALTLIMRRYPKYKCACGERLGERLGEQP